MTYLPNPVAGAPEGTVTAPCTDPVGVGVVVVGAVVVVGLVVVVGVTVVVVVVVGVVVCAPATPTSNAKPNANASAPSNRCLKLFHLLSCPQCLACMFVRGRWVLNIKK